MGGDLRVTSTVGAGATFRVKLPLSEVTNPRRDAPVEAPIYGYLGPRKTILITDDDPTHRDLLREVLAPLGFILLSAPDGPGCLALAQILGLSPRTVDNHLEQIYSKLGVENRTAAAAIAVKANDLKQ